MSASAATPRNIFQQASQDKESLRALVKDSVENSVGFTLRIYEEIAKNPTAFSNSCLEFINKAAVENLAAIAKEHKNAAMAAPNCQIIADFDERLISILNTISLETVKKAVTAFNRLVEHVNAGALDNFRFLQYDRPCTSHEMRRQILRELGHDLDPLADEHKMKLEFRFPEFTIQQDQLYVKLRAMREEILSELDGIGTVVVQDLLNNKILPSIMKNTITPGLLQFCGGKTNELPKVEEIQIGIESLIAKALAATDPLRRDIYVELKTASSVDPTLALDAKELINRVIPALICSIRKNPVSQDISVMQQRCHFVELILRQNLARIAAVAKTAAFFETITL